MGDRSAVALLLLLSLAGCGARPPAVPGAARHPVRVMSLNHCADQIVLALLPPDRIASVTWLSHDRDGSPMEREAARVGVNHGFAEEVLAQRPNLVVTGSVSTPALRAMLGRLGYPMIEVAPASGIDDIRRLTRQVAAAVDERARGEALIATMDAKLAALARSPGPPIRVVAWDRSGFAAGRGTLFDAILTAAGARNIGRDRATSSYRPDVEALLQADPALLVQGSVDPAASSLADEAVRHPLVRRYWGDRTLIVPQGYYGCGTPMIADAAWRLRRQLRAAVDRAAPALPGGEAPR